MLAEPRRKVKFSTDPRNTTWTNDDNKFGQKLMEKMGWSKGRGLGVKEDGNPLSIAVSLKQDKKGVGWSKKTEDNWIAHQDEFGALLSELNENHGTGKVTSDSSDTQKVLNLEHTSRSSKGRVHYRKFTNGKDLSVKSESDLDCVFGKRKSRSRESTAQQLLEENTLEGQIAEKIPIEDSGGLKTVTSSDSVQEYFAKKMAVMSRRKNEDTIDISDSLGAKDVESPSSILRNRSYNAESNDFTEGKKKTRNSLKVRFSVGEGEVECDESKIEIETDSFVDTETGDQVYKKKKKKSKKVKKESESECETIKEDEAACDNKIENKTALDSPSKNFGKGKKKRKNSDLSETPVPEKKVEQETDLKTEEESVVKYEKAVEPDEFSKDSSPKKKRKRKMETDLSTEEGNGIGNDKNIKTDVTVDVSSPKEKKKKRSKSGADIPAENDKRTETESGNAFGKKIKLDTVDESPSEKNKKKKKSKSDKAHVENEDSISNSPVQLNNELENKTGSLSKKKRKHRDEQEDQSNATVEIIMNEQNVEKVLEEEKDLSVKESTDLNTEIKEKQMESKKNKRKEISEDWQFEPPKIIDAEKDLINPFPNTRPEKLLETYARDTKQDVRYIFRREGPMNRQVFAMYIVLGTRSFGAVRCSSKKEARRKAAIVVLCELKDEVELKTLQGKLTVKEKGNKLDKTVQKNLLENKSNKQSPRHREDNQEQAFQGSCLQEINGYAGFPVSAEVQLKEKKAYQPNRYSEKFQRKETFTKKFGKREMFDKKPYPVSNQSDFSQSKGTHKHFTD